ncbi:MAG: HAMP domain-containing sensor histidine kinase [Bacteroidales bacterium]|nr:HAMP domain-containing sensor histidine kinase [Bacteroidales bacterium]
MQDAAGNHDISYYITLERAEICKKRKQYNKALSLAKEAVLFLDSASVVFPNRYTNHYEYAYSFIKGIYLIKGDYKNAYNYNLLENETHQAAFDLEKNVALKDLEVKYETEKKERLLSEYSSNLEMQNYELKRNRQTAILLYLALALFFIIVIVLFLLYRQKQKTAKILQIQQKELKKMNASKTKFFSIIAHDLSSPVSAFASLTEALSTSFDEIEKEDIRGYISEMRDSATGINDLLKNLLQWALSQSGYYTPEKVQLELNPVVLKAYTPLRYKAKEKGLIIENKALSPSTILNVDEKMLTTIFRNLISNAIKFADSETTIYIEEMRDESSMSITIKDKGEMLSDEDMSKLFKIEENARKIGKDSSKKGSGLGLIICKEFVEMNDGKIGVSRDNDYICFTVTFKYE